MTGVRKVTFFIRDHKGNWSVRVADTDAPPPDILRRGVTSQTLQMALDHATRVVIDDGGDLWALKGANIVSPTRILPGAKH